MFDGISLAIGVFISMAASQASSWRDPSPHKVQFVPVESSVRLEVLDWGGTGRPLLFVGCYLTAHAFDDIAPKLAKHFRVYAVTRRGVGASDRPSTGYDPQRRAGDILKVMETLRLDKPILVGHSCGGWVLHTIGAEHPERVGGLAYLDGAEDPTLKLSDFPRRTKRNAPACSSSTPPPGECSKSGRPTCGPAFRTRAS